jgi:hypothetical protein
MTNYVIVEIMIAFMMHSLSLCPIAQVLNVSVGNESLCHVLRIRSVIVSLLVRRVEYIVTHIVSIL